MKGDESMRKIFVTTNFILYTSTRSPKCKSKYEFYEGRPINKLQNGIILLIFKI